MFQELNDLRSTYHSLDNTTISVNDKAIIENLLVSCSIAEEAIQDARLSKLDQALFFLLKVCE